MNKIPFIIAIGALLACSSNTKQQKDHLYSRHLQRNVELTIINTPLPDDKSRLNLLLLNDGQEVEKLRVQEIVDSLYHPVQLFTRRWQAPVMTGLTGAPYSRNS